MPRIRAENSASPAEPKTEAEKPIERNGEQPKNALRDTQGYPYKPFKGVDGLELDFVIDKKGKVMKQGTPQHFVHRALTCHKVIAVYKNGKGTARRLDRVLYLNKKSSRGRRDKDFLNRLKSIGIPGAEF